MSMSSLLQATLEHLRSEVTLATPNTSGIRLRDGRPPASCGQLYYAVHPIRWYPGPTHGSCNISTDEMFDIGVTVTMRAGRIPPSKASSIGYMGADPSDGSALSLPGDVGGIEPKLREVITAITTGRYTILTLANNRLSANSTLYAAFDNTDVDTANERITVTAHGFGITGLQTSVRYDEDDSGSINGLTDGTTYTVTIIDANTVEFGGGVDLTVGSTGTNHRLTFIPEGFIEPLVFSGIDAEPQVVTEEWFNAQPENTEAWGWVMSAQFSGARRMQHLTSME